MIIMQSIEENKVSQGFRSVGKNSLKITYALWMHKPVEITL